MERVETLQRVESESETVRRARGFETKHLAIMRDSLGVSPLTHRDARAGVERERDETLRLLRLRALLLDEHRVNLRHRHDGAGVNAPRADVRARRGPTRETANAVRSRLRVVTRLTKSKKRREHATRLVDRQVTILVVRVSRQIDANRRSNRVLRRRVLRVLLVARFAVVHEIFERVLTTSIEPSTRPGGGPTHRRSRPPRGGGGGGCRDRRVLARVVLLFRPFPRITHAPKRLSRGALAHPPLLRVPVRLYPRGT